MHRGDKLSPITSRFKSESTSTNLSEQQINYMETLLEFSRNYDRSAVETVGHTVHFDFLLDVNTLNACNS